MRYTILALTLLLTSFAFAGDPRANCSLTKASILSVTSSGVAQVSNVGLIDLTCSFPGRPFPTQPGTSKSLPKVVSTAYEIKSNGDKEQVPSEVNLSGGGGGPTPFGGGEDEPEFVDFYLHIPLPPAELDSEVRRMLDQIEKHLPTSPTEDERKRALENLKEIYPQHRVGHFLIEFRLLDKDRVIGIGTVELEVLFKGRASDVFPSSPPA